MPNRQSKTLKKQKRKTLSFKKRLKHLLRHQSTSHISRQKLPRWLQMSSLRLLLRSHLMEKMTKNLKIKTKNRKMTAKIRNLRLRKTIKLRISTSKACNCLLKIAKNQNYHCFSFRINQLKKSQFLILFQTTCIIFSTCCFEIKNI